MMSTGRSLDDLSLGIAQLRKFHEQRARSSSPVKERRKSLDLSTHFRSMNSSLDSMLSTKSMTHEQLMKFSRSSAAEKLHISKTNYVIPIPFSIQFPPKLSAAKTSCPESPDGSRPTFVFTGTSYEPVDRSPSPCESYRSRTSYLERPPSVFSNKNKASQLNRGTFSEPSDQLSMIEEKSNSASTRCSSSSKDLPLLPSPSSASPSRILEHKVIPTSPKVVFPTLSPSHNALTPTRLNRKPLTQLNNKDKNVAAIGRNSSENCLSTSELGAILSTTNSQGNRRSPDMVYMTDSSKQALVSPPENRGVPRCVPLQFNLWAASELRVNKPACSESSRVSSLSSLSSVGELLNLNYAYMSSPNAKGDVRISSNIADCMLEDGNQGSETSQTRNPKNSDFAEEKTKDSKDLTPIFAHPQYKHQARSVPNWLSIDLQPQSGSETQDETSDTSFSTIQPIGDPVEENIEFCADDNRGSGMDFHFPNNVMNSTNNDNVKRRVQMKTNSKFSEKRSFVRNGHIHIPNLDDCNRISAQNNEWKMNKQPEKLDTPSQTTHLIGKNIPKEGFEESDSDSSFNSQFCKLQKSRVMFENQNNTVASRPSSTLSSSPIRHSRHKSMYNINFESTPSSHPTPQLHSRSKSSYDIKEGHQKIDSLEKSKDLSFWKADLLTKNHEKVSNCHGDTSNLKNKVSKFDVEEPPKKVNYSIDFKCHTASKDANESFDSAIPNNYYQRQSFGNEVSSGSASYFTQSVSDTASSYRTTITGKHTESTDPTDGESIVIDLTKEGYDVCMVQRNFSTTSYKSVLENTRDGKSVEVVLVDEDDDIEDSDVRDDLSSIYSLYLSNWKRVSFDQSADGSKMAFPRALRHVSTTSTASDASDCSKKSWAASSESQFQVKSLAAIKREQAYKTSQRLLNASANRDGKEKKGLFTKNSRTRPEESNYFDYSVSDNYDFNSYIKQQTRQ